MRLSIPFLGLALLACGQSAITNPEVPPPPPSGSVLALSAPSDSIRVGSTLQLKAELRSAVGDLLPTPELTWSVDAPAVATIDGAGRLRALAPGRVHVSVTGGNLHAALAVDVLSLDPSTVVLEAGPASLPLGGMLEMSAKVFAPANYPLPHAVITWSSSRSDVATVSGGGLVTGVAAGATVITARSGEATASRTVTVLPSVPGTIRLSGLDHTLHPSDQVQLQAIVASTTGLPMDPGIVAWSSSQASVATVSSRGVVIAISPGEAVITASAGGVTANVTAVVLPVAGPPLPGVGLIAFYRLTASDTSIEVRTGGGALLLSARVHPGLPQYEPLRLSIAPTGTSLAFDCSAGICDLSIPTGTVTPRTPVCCGAGRFVHPAWLRDGTEMVVQHEYSEIAWLDVPSGTVISRPGPFYTAAPVPSPDGRFVFYQCDWPAQYDDPVDLCQMNEDGQVTLYRWNAGAPSWSHDGTVAYTRNVWPTSDRVLVIEPHQANPDPAGPGLQEYPGFADVTETAWSPEGGMLALVRSGRLWLVSMPGVIGPVEFAHVEGTTIAGISWR